MRKINKTKPQKLHMGGSIKTLLVFAGRKIVFPEANRKERMEEGAENVEASESQYPFPSNISTRNTAHSLWTQGNNKAEIPAPFHALKKRPLWCHFARSLSGDWISTLERSWVFQYTHTEQIKMERQKE